MPVAGTRNLSTRTPVHRLKAVAEVRRHDRAPTGTARGAGEEVPLNAMALGGGRLTWPQDLTEPLGPNPAFDAIVGGGTLPGTFEAGRAPATKATGEHRPTLEHQA